MRTNEIDEIKSLYAEKFISSVENILQQNKIQLGDMEKEYLKTFKQMDLLSNSRKIVKNAHKNLDSTEYSDISVALRELKNDLHELEKDFEANSKTTEYINPIQDLNDSEYYEFENYLKEEIGYENAKDFFIKFLDNEDDDIRLDELLEELNNSLKNHLNDFLNS